MLAAINDFVTNTVADHGVWAVFLLMLVESACIPVPSEVTMLYAGYLVSKDQSSLLAMTAAGVGGNLVGSWLIYWIGASGGRALLLRYGRWIGIREHHVHVADRWFERRGNWAVLIGRVLPVVRTFISLPAGVARMRLVPFTVYTLIGCIPWVAGLTAIGVALGPHWEKAHTFLHHIDDVVIGAIILGILWLVVRHLRQRRQRSSAR